LGMRDPSRALEVLKPLLESDTRDVEALNMAGQAYMLTADYGKAAELFGRVSALSPESVEARTRLGMARMAAGDDTRALQDLEIAAAGDSSSIIAEVGIIANLLKKGDSARAMQVLAALEKKQPDSAAVANIRGAILLSTKDSAGARKAFERALTLEPENIGALTQLTRLDMAEAKLADARKRLEAFAQKFPKNIRAGLILAQFLQDSNAPVADTRAALERAVAADPARNEARSALIQYLLRSSEGKQALNVAQQAVAAQPDSPDMMRLLGRTQMAAGEKQQAVQTYAKLQASEPQNPLAIYDLGEAQRATDDLAAAESNFRRALEIKPDFADAAQRLASILLRSNKQDEALQLAKSLQKANPGAPSGYMLEADILAGDKRWPEVSSALQTAWQKSKSPQILLGLRSALNLQGKSAEAQKLVADYLKTTPKDGVVRMQLADEALKEGRYAEALAYYKTLSTLAPGNVVISNNLAWVANKQADPKALEYAEQALKLAPRVPAVMETVGSVLLDRGQAQRGIALIKEAVELAPKASAVRLGYARALARSGDKAGAQAEATKALEGVPAELPLHAEIVAFRKSL
jgi:cellulose synthase operon protein C